MVRALVLKCLDADAHIIHFFQIAKHYAEGVQDHWQNTEVEVEGNSDLVSKPHDQEGISPNPTSSNQKRKWIKVVLAWKHGVWSGDVLHSHVRDGETILKSSLPVSGPGDGLAVVQVDA